MKSTYKILTLKGKPLRPTASRAFPSRNKVTHFFEDSPKTRTYTLLSILLIPTPSPPRSFVLSFFRSIIHSNQQTLNQKLPYIYLTLLLLATFLPINNPNSGTSVLINNYIFNIRWDYLLHVLVYIPIPFLLKKVL